MVANVSRPSSTSCPIATAVNIFPIDPTLKRVSGVFRRAPSTLAEPVDVSSSVRPPFVTSTEPEKASPAVTLRT